MRSIFKTFCRDDRGLEMIEYAVATAVVAATLVAASGRILDGLTGRFGDMSSTVNGVRVASSGGDDGSDDDGGGYGDDRGGGDDRGDGDVGNDRDDREKDKKNKKDKRDKRKKEKAEKQKKEKAEKQKREKAEKNERAKAANDRGRKQDDGRDSDNDEGRDDDKRLKSNAIDPDERPAAGSNSKPSNTSPNSNNRLRGLLQKIFSAIKSRGR